VADSVMSDVVNQISAAQTAVMTAQNSIATPAQRAAAIQSLAGIRDALVSDMNTQFGGTFMFSGTKTTSAYTVAGGIVSAYQGNHNQMSLDISSSRSVAVSYDASQIMQGADPQDVFTTLSNLAIAIQAGDSAGMAQGLTFLDNAFNRATTAQTAIGLSENAVSNISQQMTTSINAATARRSSLQDANMAAVISQMTQDTTAYQAALAAFAKVGQLSLMDYVQ
jgi:flagellar hook-associated protein 3 FlgL